MSDYIKREDARKAACELCDWYGFCDDECKYNPIDDVPGADVVERPRWIPVTNRLPEDRRDVLVYAGVLFPYITVGYYDGRWKFSYNDEEIAGSADCWMPLPEPPKEGDT